MKRLTTAATNWMGKQQGLTVGRRTGQPHRERFQNSENQVNQKAGPASTGEVFTIMRTLEVAVRTQGNAVASGVLMKLIFVFPIHERDISEIPWQRACLQLIASRVPCLLLG